MLAIVAAVILSTAAGVAAERRYGGSVGIATRRALMVVLYTVLPLVTFFNLARAQLDADVGLGVLAAYGALALTGAIVLVVCTRVLHLSRPTTGSVLCCVLVANTAYLGYPLVIAQLGADRLSEAVVYDVLVATPTMLLGAFSVGAAFGTKAGEGTRERLKAFFTRNPALYAALAALIVPDALAPDVLVDASRIAIIAILPLGFFAVGAALAEEAEDGVLAFPPRLDRPVLVAVIGRLMLAPALLYILALPLVDLPGPYLLLASMPCAINALIVTHAYGLDLRVTASAVATSTAIAVIGFVVIPPLT